LRSAGILTISGPVVYLKTLNTLFQRALPTLTLVVCLRGKDGVVLGADSRGTIGDPRALTAINDTHRKLFALSKFVGIVSYGQAELAAQAIVEIKAKTTEDKQFFSEVFPTAVEVLRQRYQEWFRNVALEQRPIIGFIAGGYESMGETKLYYLSSPLDFAPQLVTTGIALGGVPQYATYLVHRLYNPEMGRKQLLRLAAYLISETATQDPKVGGPIRLAEIAPKEGFQELSEADVRAILRSNEELNNKLRASFLEG